MLDFGPIKFYHSLQRPPTPWKSILTSQAVWALAVAHIAHNWGYHTLFTTLPQYLSDVLKFSVAAVSTFGINKVTPFINSDEF